MMKNLNIINLRVWLAVQLISACPMLVASVECPQISEIGKNGITRLMVAACNGNDVWVQSYLQQDDDPCVKNNDSPPRTAEDYAWERGHTEVVKLLENSIKKKGCGSIAVASSNSSVSVVEQWQQKVQTLEQARIIRCNSLIPSGKENSLYALLYDACLGGDDQENYSRFLDIRENDQSFYDSVISLVDEMFAIYDKECKELGKFLDKPESFKIARNILVPLKNDLCAMATKYDRLAGTFRGEYKKRFKKEFSTKDTGVNKAAVGAATGGVIVGLGAAALGAAYRYNPTFKQWVKDKYNWLKGKKESEAEKLRKQLEQYFKNKK